MDKINLHATTDAAIWAFEFVRIKRAQGWTLDQIDEGLMTSWFANAMCAQMDKDSDALAAVTAERDALLEAVGRVREICNAYRKSRPAEAQLAMIEEIDAAVYPPPKAPDVLRDLEEVEELD
jgi:hypothetical protein